MSFGAERCSFRFVGLLFYRGLPTLGGVAPEALEDPFFGGEYFEGHGHLEEPKFVILEDD